jgi:hypothetical protein
MSDRPFALRVHYSAIALLPPRLASVRLEWDGEPFVVERLIDPSDFKAGYADVHFADEQTAAERCRKVVGHPANVA